MSTLLIHHTFINLLIRNRKRKLKALAGSVSRYCRLATKILDVRIDSDLKKVQTEGHLVIANHMSYMDILILSSIYPSLYVTSVEMKETFFLGQVCSLCACLFTERRKGKRSAATMKKDITDIGELLSYGFATTIFPEGTSTNGQQLLPFKTTLLESAVATKKKVLPIAFRYTYLNGDVFSEDNCDNICWHGDQSFGDSVWRMIKLRDIRVKVRVSYSLSPLEFGGRNALGKMGEKLITELYQEMKLEHC